MKSRIHGAHLVPDYQSYCFCWFSMCVLSFLNETLSCMFVSTSTLIIIVINCHPLPFPVFNHSCIHYLPGARASGSFFVRFCYFCLSGLWETLSSGFGWIVCICFSCRNYLSCALFLERLLSFVVVSHAQRV